MADFIHLHTASSYSMRYGADPPARLASAAASAGQPAVALTDRDGVYGAVRFVRACADAGVAAILGVDLAVEPLIARPGSIADGSIAYQVADERRRTPARGGTWVEPPMPRVVLLARGATGWASLCRLISAAHLSGERSDARVSMRQVAEHGDGLVALLGPSSQVGWALHRRREDEADRVLRAWRDSLGEGCAVISVASHRSAHRTGRDGPMPLSSTGAARMLGWARSRGAPTVLTNAVRYVERSGAPVVDVLDAVRRLVPLDRRHLDRDNAEGRFKDGDEMALVAREIADLAGADPREAQRLLERTVELGQGCRIDPRADLGMGEVFVPELEILLPEHRRAGPRDVAAEHAAAQAVLAQRCEAGLNGRGYGGTDPASRAAAQRLAEELRIIAELGFAGYFLTVAEVVDLIRGMGVRVAARGSGAGSLVNHVLGISGVDPMRHGLLMERFLSPLRRVLPDIDIDVESARRTQIYERILERFGGQRCACVSMMETYRVRHAVRDVGAALGLPPGEVDAFAKAFPHIRARDARAALRDLPELRSSSLGRQAARGELDHYLVLVESLDGLPRHIALHPCGVLLSDSTLLDRTPVEASWLGFPMSQFDKDDVEDLGLLKLDVLGIRMQSAMAHAIAEVERVDGELIDLDAVPLDDPATFDLIASTRTLGCFQIESPGQRELIGKFGPETFDDLIIDISLFRPGPVKSDMVTPFLNARHGWAEPQYLHPDLRAVLHETSGVVVFHEQVMQIVSIIAGCSLAEADETRRALGSFEGQQQVRGWFYSRALRGYDSGGGRADLGRADGVRFLRLLQGARRGLRAAHLSVGVAEDAPSGGIPGGGAHPRPRHVPEAVDPGRRPPLRGGGAAHRRERLLRGVPGGAGRRRVRHPAAVRRGEGDIRGRGRPDHGGPAVRGPGRLRHPVGCVPAGRREPGRRRGVRRAVRDRPRCARGPPQSRHPPRPAAVGGASWTATTVRCRRGGRRVSGSAPTPPFWTQIPPSAPPGSRRPRRPRPATGRPSCCSIWATSRAGSCAAACPRWIPATGCGRSWRCWGWM